jgi:hypothetical protein
VITCNELLSNEQTITAASALPTTKAKSNSKALIVAISYWKIAHPMKRI